MDRLSKMVTSAARLRAVLATTPERYFRDRIMPVPESGCWIWVGADGSRGYGQAKLKEKSYRAHRAMYEKFIGPIPDGMTLDHLCCVKSCVNPAHLEPCTDRVNILRSNGVTAMKARQQTCRLGHPLVVLKPNGDRGCRECRRVRHRAKYADLKALGDAPSGNNKRLKRMAQGGQDGTR
jgi:hypothetical protein